MNIRISDATGFAMLCADSSEFAHLLIYVLSTSSFGNFSTSLWRGWWQNLPSNILFGFWWEQGTPTVDGNSPRNSMFVSINWNCFFDNFYVSRCFHGFFLAFVFKTVAASFHIRFQSSSLCLIRKTVELFAVYETYMVWCTCKAFISERIWGI